jgi:cbb3-type cytochrome oxidase subunit 3
MELLVGFAGLLGFAIACAIFLVSFPTLVIALALWLYRYGRKQERWQREQAAKLNEAWIRELEQ